MIIIEVRTFADLEDACNFLKSQWRKGVDNVSMEPNINPDKDINPWVVRVYQNNPLTTDSEFVMK
jgi:hypothetical protein